MPKNNRPRTYPRAFSVMVTEHMGTVLDMLQVVDSSRDYRASQADATRRLLEKGMAVEALEQALTYVAGERHDVVSGLLAQARSAMGDELGEVRAGLDRATGLLWAVLCRMWPEVATEVEKLDVKNVREDRLTHQRLLAGPPLTAKGRPLTAGEIREQALADIAAGRVQAPEIVPPRSVQEAREQARLHQAADRVAMNSGVSAETLLAMTPAGQEAGLTVPDETAGATGWTDNTVRGNQSGYGKREGAEIVPTPSPGELLRRIRSGEA